MSRASSAASASSQHREAWERALAEERCELVTVVGDAGVGKSRLAAELLVAIDARIVRGRCLSYGEGITYWPVVEVLKQLDALPSDRPQRRAIRSLLGESGRGTSAEEIAWAFRKLLEEQAPLVVVFDDIQWGEETFLDLVEHLALLSSAAPILLSASPGRSCSSAVRLAGRRSGSSRFHDADADALIGDRAARAARADRGCRRRQPALPDRDAGDGRRRRARSTCRPTLRALLAARLDQLEPPSARCSSAARSRARSSTAAPSRRSRRTRRRSTRGWRARAPGADPARPRPARRRRRLPLPPPADPRRRLRRSAEGDPRRASTSASPTGSRSAAPTSSSWTRSSATTSSRPRATRRSSGQPTESSRSARARGLPLRAAARSGAGDQRAQPPLLERALELTRPCRLDVHARARPRRCSSRRRRERPRRSPRPPPSERARPGDEPGEALARVVAAEARAELRETIRTSTSSSGSRARRCRSSSRQETTPAWCTSGSRSASASRTSAAASRTGRTPRSRRSATARLAGRGAASGAVRARDRARSWPAAGGRGAANARCRSFAEIRSPRPLLRRAQLLAMLGRFDEAWALALPAGERCARADRRRLGRVRCSARSRDSPATTRRGRALLRRTATCSRQRGQLALLSTYAPQLGRSLCALGRYDEAEPLAQLGRELGDEQDSSRRRSGGRCRRSSSPTAASTTKPSDSPARRSRSRSGTDALNDQGDALYDLAEVSPPPAAATRRPRRSSRRSTATSARRTWPWSRRSSRSWRSSVPACPSCGAGEPGRARASATRAARRSRPRRRARAAQDGHRPVLRRDRLDRARGVDRPGGAARPARPLLRADEGDRRVARGDGGEVHRRRGHGRLRRPAGARGRRAARLPRRGEMRDALPELGVEARIGVNTGEVVTGTEERLVTGRRRQCRRPAGAGRPARRDPDRGGDARARPRRGRDRGGRAARAEGQARSRPRPPVARRARGAGARARDALRGPLGGGGALAAGMARVLDESRCELVTIVGDAGVGKSRLIAEFVADIETRGRAGRCLSYGEGITYWPVVEVLKQLGALPADPAAASSLRSLLGESGEGTSADDIAWAFRKLLEECCAARCASSTTSSGASRPSSTSSSRSLCCRVRRSCSCVSRGPISTERRSDWPVTVRLEPLVRRTRPS